MKLQLPSTSHHHHCKLFTSIPNLFSNKNQVFPSPQTYNSHSYLKIKCESRTPISVPPGTSCHKPKIVVIMGATGAGKSRLSIDLATRFFDNAEIINSDKMQVYTGLDITTNKITTAEQSGVPHHLLGVIDPAKSAFTPSDYREIASEIINDVNSRGGLPVIVGGSNSLIYSLVTKRFDPDLNVFSGPDPNPDLKPDPDTDRALKTVSLELQLRYDCCFIWVDVKFPVLNRYLIKRVDKMLDSGMFEELVEFFRSGGYERVNRAGLGQAIGIPEFEAYFKKFGFERMDVADFEEMEAFNVAVGRIKDNTCELAKRQVSKIMRLRDAGLELKRVDATEAFSAVMREDSSEGRVAEIWEKQVVEPSVKMVKRFLDE